MSIPKQKPICFRPHHVLCTIGFEGRGYSPEFVSHYTKVKSALTSHTPIQITKGLDTICGPCPNHNGRLCNKEAFIETLDARHLQALDLTLTTYTWGALVDKVRTHISPNDLVSLCKGCAWLSFGLCARAVAKIKNAA